MQIIENIALISINATLLFQLASFLLFLFILNRVMVRPIRRTIAERDGYVERIGYEIEAADKLFTDISRQIQKEEAASRRAAFELKDRMEAEGLHAAAALMAETRREINTLRMMAQKDTQTRLSAARKEIDAHAKTIADQMIASILDRRRTS